MKEGRFRLKETKNSDNKIINLINQNYGWLIAIGSIFIAFITTIFKIIEYLQANTYFNLYGIDHSFYESKNIGIFNTIFNNIIIVTLLTSGILSIYYYKKAKNSYKINKKKKKQKLAFSFKIKRKIKWYKENKIYVISFILANTFLTYYILEERTLISFIANFMMLLISEIFFIKMTSVEKIPANNTDYNIKNDLIRILILLPIFCFIIIIFFTFSNKMIAFSKRDYRIIDENKVIVYTNENYYIILDCKIEENNLIIYKGTQQKIENNQIPTQLIKFEKIIFN